ncbi:MAG TPA: universal stress protein [Gemmatimonadales bacterium]|nr:universal stress protein [Gemmatimonadales bacterium]
MTSALRSIVVPLDGSPFSEHALPVAAAVGRAARAVLRLVLVHSLPPPPHDKPSARVYVSVELAVRRSQREYLRGWAARLRKSHGLRVTTLVPDGPVGPTLVRWIHDTDADLVVMTTHGRGALGRALVGSVADQLVRSLDVPVLLVPPDPGEDAGGGWKPGEVVAGVDGSRPAEAAVGRAASLARVLGVPITVARVVEPIAASTDQPLPFPAALDGELTEVRRHEALDYVEEIAEGLRKQGVAATGEALIGASPAGVLLERGRADRGTILAVGTRGLGGVKRLMLGSVADKLVRRAAVPVLVVPP